MQQCMNAMRVVKVAERSYLRVRTNFELSTYGCLMSLCDCQDNYAQDQTDAVLREQGMRGCKLSCHKGFMQMTS